jgi:hypothetical protein
MGPRNKSEDDSGGWETGGENRPQNNFIPALLHEAILGVRDPSPGRSSWTICNGVARGSCSKGAARCVGPRTDCRVPAGAKKLTPGWRGTVTSPPDGGDRTWAAEGNLDRWLCLSNARPCLWCGLGAWPTESETTLDHGSNHSAGAFRALDKDDRRVRVAPDRARQAPALPALSKAKPRAETLRGWRCLEQGGGPTVGSHREFLACAPLRRALARRIATRFFWRAAAALRTAAPRVACRIATRLITVAAGSLVDLATMA